MLAKFFSKKTVSWQIGLVGLAAALTVVVCSVSAGAQESQLRQQVEEPVCDQPSDCDMTPPVIESTDSNKGRPMIFGRYDATFARTLRVTFGGVTYVLGVHSQLTAQNGEWQLDLGDLSSPLPPGEYEIVVEQVGYDGQIIVIKSTLTIRESDSSGGDNDGGGDGKPVEDPDSRPVPNAPNTGIIQMSKQVGLFATGVLVLTIMALVWRQLKNRKS